MPVSISSRYADIISIAIRDFDDIFDELQGKLVTLSETNVLTDGNKTDGSTPTSYYAGFIRDQLFRVGEANAAGTSMTGITPELQNGVIRSYAGLTNNAADGTYGTPGVTKLSVTFAIPNAGYYNSQSKIVGSVPYQDIVLSTDNIAGYASGNNYVVLNKTAGAANNIPMLSVTMPHGNVSVSYEEHALTATQTISATLGIKSTGTTVLGASLDSISGGYTINLTKDANYTAHGTITPAIVKNSGFIVSSDVTIATPEFDIDTDMTQSEQLVYIPAGTLTGTLANTAAVTINGSPTLGLTTTQPANNYYALTASTANLKVLGTTTHGYVPDASSIEIGTVTDVTETYYIHAGSVPDTDITLTSSQLSYTDPSHMVSESGTTGHALSYSVNMSTLTKTIDPGFISDNAYTVDVGGSNTIYIKEGRIDAAASITTGNWSGSTSILSAGKTGYTVTIPITGDLTQTITNEGYVDAAGQLHKTTANSSITVGVDAGSATIAPTLTGIATPVNRDDENAASAVGETIFYDNVPESGDYYAITAGVSKTSVTPGYMSTNDIHLTNSIVKYLKKATFKYVENMDGNEQSFLEVTSGGYVPSGVIMDIADISGEIDEADVTVDLTDDGSITTSSKTTGLSYYTITASKGTTDAGYMGGSDHGSVHGATYVLRGSESLATDVASTTFDPDTDVSALGANASGKYTFSLTNNVSNTLTFQEGYIKQSNITLNGQSNTLTKTITDVTTINVTKGVFGITAKALTVGISADENIDTVSSGGYAISPTLTGTITVNTTTAGYIQENDDSKIQPSFTNSDATRVGIQIKKGTGATTNDWTVTNAATSSSQATLTHNFATGHSGSYTVTLGGYATAQLTLNNGYYGDAEKVLSGAKGGRVNLSKTLTVNHGKSTVNVQATDKTLTMTDTSVANSPRSLTLLTTAPSSGEYITLQSSVTMGSTTTLTEGYVFNQASDKVEDSETDGLIRYVKGTSLVKTTTALATNYNGNAVAANTSVYGVLTIGSNDGDIDGASSYATKTASETGLREAMIIPTKDTYALYDTKVALTSNAMGTGVKDELKRLQSRLAGTLSAS